MLQKEIVEKLVKQFLHLNACNVPDGYNFQFGFDDLLKTVWENQTEAYRCKCNGNMAQMDRETIEEVLWDLVYSRVVTPHSRITARSQQRFFTNKSNVEKIAAGFE